MRRSSEQTSHSATRITSGYYVTCVAYIAGKENLHSKSDGIFYLTRGGNLHLHTHTHTHTHTYNIYNS
jgi:hypothetical protein